MSVTISSIIISFNMMKHKNKLKHHQIQTHDTVYCTACRMKIVYLSVSNCVSFGLRCKLLFTFICLITIFWCYYSARNLDRQTDSLLGNSLGIHIKLPSDCNETPHEVLPRLPLRFPSAVDGEKSTQGTEQCYLQNILIRYIFVN